MTDPRDFIGPDEREKLEHLAAGRISLDAPSKPAEHAKLSPSGAARWMACAGSLALESAYPDKSSDFAEEGTLAHAVAADCLDEEWDAAVFIGNRFDYVDHGVTKTVNGITADMAREVQKYLDAVRGYLDEGDELFVEQRLPIFSGNTAGVPEQFGTSDTVIIKAEQRRLVVADLKFGRGVQVFAEKNPQLMLYALGALDEFGLLYEFDDVLMAIHQPRLNHIDEWVCTVAELREFEQVALAAGEKALTLYDFAKKDQDTVWAQSNLNPGDKQCQFCKAKGDCPALRDKVLATVAGDFNQLYEEVQDSDMPVEPDPLPVIDCLKSGEIAVSITEAEKIIAAAHGVAPKAVDFEEQRGGECGFIVKKPTIRPALDEPEARAAQLDDDHLAICMDSVDLVEGWCKAVRAEVERRMLAGTPVPGWKLVTGKAGSRAWSDADEAAKLLKAMRLRDDVMYDFSLISPTSAEKLHAAGTIKPRQWAKLQDLISRSNGKPSVAPATDKRPALDIGKVEDQFDSLDDSSEDLV